MNAPLPAATRFTLALALALGAASCSEPNQSATAGAQPPRRGTLDLEIRDQAVVNISELANSVEVTVKLTKGHGVVADGAALTGAGRIARYPEADAVLYTARFDAPAVPEGRCGSEPVSLALSLHADADNSLVAGSLTAYCGADRWYGLPAREPLRLRGSFD